MNEIMWVIFEFFGILFGLSGISVLWDWHINRSGDGK